MIAFVRPKVGRIFATHLNGGGFRLFEAQGASRFGLKWDSLKCFAVA